VSGGFIPVSGAPWPVSGGPAAGGFDPSSGGFAHGGGAPSGTFASPHGGPSAGGFASPGGPAHGGLAPPARPRGRGGLVLVAAVVAGVMVLLGAGVAGVVWFNHDEDPDRTAGNGPGATSSGQPTGQQASGQPTGGRYAVTNLPENLCEKVDLGPLGANYKKDLTAPYYQRTLTTVVGTSTCTLGRQNDATTAFLTVTFLAYVYADTNLAVTTQKQALDNAKLNDQGVVTVDGVGDEAFIYRLSVTGSGAASQPANYSFEMRESNLRWTISVVATRVSGNAWSDQERSKLVSDISAAVKATKVRYGTT
jgi:hypothetical protein